MAKSETVRLKIQLIRFEEGPLGTNGTLAVSPRSDLSHLPAPIPTIEKSWAGNQPELSRIPPRQQYRLMKHYSSTLQEEVIKIVHMNISPLLGRENEEICIVPARDTSLLGGSIGVVSKHTSLGKGLAPREAFEPLREFVFAALERGEIVILEIRS